MRDIRDKLEERQHLTAEEAASLCRSFLGGELDDVEIADLLVLLAEKGETADEIVGFSEELLQHAESIPFEEPTVDICGTGGSGLERFNISTAIAFIVGCFGTPIAKHGNRGSRKANGSFDLLEALGIPIDLGGEQVAQCLRRTGIGFIFAHRFHPVMGKVAPARKIAKRRTVFNLAGPLSNPTQVDVQIVGTANRDMGPVLAEICLRLGRRRGYIVWGTPGIDDLSIAGESLILEFSAAGTSEEIIVPDDLGLTAVDYRELPGGDAVENARIFNALVDGKDCGGMRSMVALNAGLVLRGTGVAKTLEDGIRAALQTIDSGAMKRKFEEYRTVALSLVT